jgi:hypothetical protein
MEPRPRLRSGPRQARRQAILDPANITPLTDHDRSERAPLVVRSTPETVTRLLLGLIGAVVMAGVVARVAILWTTPDDYGIRELARRFDLDIEHNIPSWFASGTLLAAAVLLGAIAYDAWLRRLRFRWHWTGLAAMFVCLSIDEATSLHEMVMASLHGRFDLQGLLFFAWVIPAAAAVLVVGLVYVRFFKDLPVRTGQLFLVAAVVYVGAALGLEAVGGMVVEQHGFESLRYSLVMLLEESLEFLGVALFLYALLDHLRAECGGLSLHLTPRPSVPETGR